MSSSSASSSSGIGFAGMLTILFIGLKLTGYIAWSWLWVLSPLWIGVVVVIVGLLLMLGGAVGELWIKGKKRSKRNKPEIKHKERLHAKGYPLPPPNSELWVHKKSFKDILLRR